MADLIEQNLKKRFGDDIHFLKVEDVSGGDDSKFLIVISLSNGFVSVKVLEQHRMINGKYVALADIKDNIHEVGDDNLN